jgi:membrane protein DedA with SNARE-associated domain
MADLPHLIETWGYWVLAIGCLLEGETVLALAGFAAHRGHLDFGVVLVVAAIAGFTGDQIFYWIGRRHGHRVLRRFPAVAEQAGRVHALIERHHDWLIVTVRFMYGLRIAGPILIGSAGIPPGRFAAYNALGAALWAVLVAGFGWVFGEAVEKMLGDMHRIEGLLAVALVALFAGVFVWKWWQRRRRHDTTAPGRHHG